MSKYCCFVKTPESFVNFKIIKKKEQKKKKVYAIYFGINRVMLLGYISSQKIKLEKNDKNCIIFYGEKKFFDKKIYVNKKDFLSQERKKEIKIIEDRTIFD